MCVALFDMKPTVIICGGHLFCFVQFFAVQCRAGAPPNLHVTLSLLDSFEVSDTSSWDIWIGQDSAAEECMSTQNLV